MNQVLITNIQRFSLHDGPGIRTTVFMKGCSVHCPWCANPENISPKLQTYVKNGQSGIYGKRITLIELYNEIIKDRIYYKESIAPYSQTGVRSEFDLLPGGVTFSGGEPLLQVEKLIPLLKRLNEDGIHITVETSLFVNNKMMEVALNYVDFFYIDAKLLDPKKCKDEIGGNFKQYLSNYIRLCESKVPFIIRVPVIFGKTDTPQNLDLLILLINSYIGNLIRVELLKEHNLGLEKYKTLISAGNDILMPHYNNYDDDVLIKIEDKIRKETQKEVVICKV